MFEAASVIGLNLFSLPEAVIGAAAVLVAYHTIRRAVQLMLGFCLSSSEPLSVWRIPHARNRLAQL
jgi:hypothetical protein